MWGATPVTESVAEAVTRRTGVRRTFAQARFSPRPRRSRVVRKLTWQTSLDYVTDADDLTDIQPFDEWAVRVDEAGKWTDLFLSNKRRQLFRRAVAKSFVPLGDYGAPELGTVTVTAGIWNFPTAVAAYWHWSILETDIRPFTNEMF